MKLISSSFFYFFIVAFFVATILNQFVIFFGILPNYRYTSFVNLIFEIYLFICLLFNPKGFKKLIYPIVLLMFFLIGQWFLKKDFFFLFSKEQFYRKGYWYVLNGYFFIFLFFTGIELLENKTDLAKRVYKLFLWVFNINALFVLFGWITNSIFFTSYFGSNRFGYTGMLGHHTLMFYMYCLLIVFLYNKYQKLKSRVDLLNLIFIIFVSCLSGKKGVFLFLSFMFLYHVFIYKKRYKLILLVSFVFCLMLFYWFIDLIMFFLLKIFPFWKSLYERTDLTTLVSSKRNLSFIKFKDYIYDNWSLVNYFFGGANYPENWVEMSIVDLFSFFGIIGLIVCVYWFWTKINEMELRQLTLIGLIFCVSILCGNFIINVNLIIFLSYLILIFNNKIKNN